MPLYDYVCQNGHRETRLRPMAARRRAVTCQECGGRSKLTLAAPAVNCWDPGWEFDHQRHDGDGKMSFPSEKAFEAHLRENHSFVYSLGIREQ